MNERMTYTLKYHILQCKIRRPTKLSGLAFLSSVCEMLGFLLCFIFGFSLGVAVTIKLQQLCQGLTTSSKNVEEEEEPAPVATANAKAKAVSRRTPPPTPPAADIDMVYFLALGDRKSSAHLDPRCQHLKKGSKLSSYLVCKDCLKDL